ncbi:cellobiose transport system substrate-binding protein [Krasilnikovia cinnamomea]|uniref:Cellobiose transport system substrate-binding protein n=1 Tax=Krasilnikovia cinnamomea TaxID=349313 RepID=A0A4Q7ZS36_9ACTN|nr:extracellular solute-binding protein [Krasilnikovia cinnamomea]RZU53423.1 cellobiose transport system substrate-binding protein [Krasilnikovia cinnamomea]
MKALRAGLAAALALVTMTCVGACSGTSVGTDTEPGTITLKVNYWGDFGLKNLIPLYTKDHPNIRIQLNPGDVAQQHEDLQKYLVAGSGAPDIAALDTSYTVSFRNQAQRFADLGQLGASTYQDRYLPWKWQETLSPEGRQIGLGTDIGGLAMCYRSDLFKAAGLPTERDKVSALIQDWDAYIRTGEQYLSRSGGKKFVDGAGLLMEAVLQQQQTGYVTPGDILNMDGGPKIAWDTATKVVASGLSANLKPFTPEWNAGMKNGSFATIPCPAWMQAYIKDQAPNTAGKWDIARPPGGAGNFGGSFWSIPAQGKHIKEAYAFVEWLVQPAQQLAIFKEVGNLPAQPALWDDPAIRDARNPFFNGAPVGRIFTESARNVTPQYQGKQTARVRTEVSNVLDQVQEGKIKGAAAWEKAKSAAVRAADR